MEWNGCDGMGCKWIEGAARRSTGDDVDAIDAKTLEGGVEEVTWREHFRLGFHPYCHPLGRFMRTYVRRSSGSSIPITSQ
jgi:hypothetical protein